MPHNIAKDLCPDLWTREITIADSRITTLNMIFSVWLYLVLLPPYPAQH